jgi:putative transposase
MPWRSPSPMDRKTQFIADHLRGTLSFTELCRHYDISRKTGYKWIGRYQSEGPSGLEDRSRRPHLSPTQTEPDLVEAILAARKRHPCWGAKKLLRLLADQHPERSWPGRSAVCELLARHGLVTKPKRRHKPGHPGKPCVVAAAPNHLWSADFKGQFKTLDGIYCYPLTVTDNFSRYLLGCKGLPSTETATAKVLFERLFREYGLPDRIRTDNGPPFAAVSLARLSDLSAWWVRLGVLPDLIEPGRPQQNGRHERMHRTLKAETAFPPAPTLRAQQRRFDRFRDEFNRVRPHEAIGLRTPASLYTASARPFPERLPPLEYPAHFQTRYVSHNNGFRWRSQCVRVSSTVVGEYLGLEEIDNGVWDVYYGALKLGRLLEEHMRIEDAYGSLWRYRQKL